MNNSQAAVAVIIMSLVTIGLRALPFLLFREKKAPAFIEFLGKYLPFAIMGMLVVYCLKGISFMQMPFGLPEIIAVAVVVGLHVQKRNTLLSIVCGTACYMLLIHII